MKLLGLGSPYMLVKASCQKEYMVYITIKVLNKDFYGVCLGEKEVELGFWKLFYSFDLN